MVFLKHCPRFFTNINIFNFYKAIWGKDFSYSIFRWEGLPRRCSGKESSCQYRRHKRHRVNLCREDPLGKETETHFGVLPGKFREQRSPVDYSPWDRDVSDTTEHALGNNWACAQTQTMRKLSPEITRPSPRQPTRGPHRLSSSGGHTRDQSAAGEHPAESNHRQTVDINQSQDHVSLQKDHNRTTRLRCVQPCTWAWGILRRKKRTIPYIHGV